MQDTSLFKHPDCFYIGGEWVKPSSSATIDVINSSTEDRFTTVAEARAEDVNRAVAAARKAFDTGPWPSLSHAERAAYLDAIGAEFTRRAQDTAQIWSTESGVLHKSALDVAGRLEDIYKFYSAQANTYPFMERHVAADGGVGLLVREPVGVVAAIIPWNAPPLLIAHKCSPALLAGCTVVLKASPEAPGAAYLLAEVCEKVGVPPGVVNILTADRAVSELLVRHPDVDKVTFTGSTAAGRKIASICGERIARCTLELGGKSPAIILDDFDVEVAAKTLAHRAPFLTGQVCAMLTRIIVSESRHDALVDALSAEFAKIQVGSAFDPSSGMGPLAMRRQRDRVESYIERGKAEGAQLACGGGRPAHLSRGYFIEPTVFGHVDNRSTIGRDEIFGPVVSVIPASSEAQAVEIANDTIYGLNAAVFTNDADRAYAIARKIRSGTVSQNGHRTDFTIAFGGFKQSGIGREGGKESLGAFTEVKTVILNELPVSAARQLAGRYVHQEANAREGQRLEGE